MKVASHYVMILYMSSQHADQALTVRPPAEVTEQAKAILGDRNLEIRSFVTACLAALAADPDGFLEGLTNHWPPEKPRGRPPRQPTH